MLVVLMQWVLKFLRVLEDLLRPIPLFGVTEDPALHVLGFHHEHPVAGHNDVVDLGGTVFGGQGDVFYEVVARFVEKQLSGNVDHGFAGFAFEPGCSQNWQQDEQRYEIPELIR